MTPSPLSPACACAVHAAIVEHPGAPFSFGQLSLEAPRPHEVLVRVVATGICQTDAAMRDSPVRVPKPVVLGHEGAGVVEAIGSAVTKVAPGDHVVMTFASCGRCANCLGGRPAYCLAVSRLNFGAQRDDGSSALSRPAGRVNGHFFGQSSFATHALASERNVVPVRRDVPLESLGPLGCGVQTGAGAVLNSLRVRPGSRLAVFGVGSVGLSAVMAGQIAGAAQVIGVDVNPERLALARELGATDVVDARDDDLVGRLIELSQGGLDYTLDTSGHATSIDAAIGALATLGTCGLAAVTKTGPVPVQVPHLLGGGRSVRGVHQGDSVPDLFIPQLIEWHRAGRFPFERLITYFPFEQINKAMDQMLQGRVIKPVLRMP